MFEKPVRLIALALGILLMVGFLAGVQSVTVVRAQSSTSVSSSACMSCHEDQYYLYDTGRWYCVTEAQERCVNCHTGNVDTLNKQEAHTGLIANPLSDGGQHCQTCHAQDTETYIQNVTSQTGYHAPLEVEPYIPLAANALPLSSLLSSEQTTPFWFAPAAIVVFLFWLWLATRTSRA